MLISVVCFAKLEVVRIGIWTKTYIFFTLIFEMTVSFPNNSTYAKICYIDIIYFSLKSVNVSSNRKVQNLSFPVMIPTSFISMSCVEKFVRKVKCFQSNSDKCVCWSLIFISDRIRWRILRALCVLCKNFQLEKENYWT